MSECLPRLSTPSFIRLIREHRQITISITARRGVVNQDLLTIEVREDLTIADLKAVIESETGVLPSFQQLFHNAVELQDDAKTLEQCQIQGGNMLGMLVLDPQSRGSRAPRPNPARGGSQPHGGQLARGGQESDPEMFRLGVLGQPQILARIRATNPDLADAVSDPIRFREVFQNMYVQQAEAGSVQQRELALLNADPFNPETQAKIEEEIRQQRVMENLQDAMDYTPEGKSNIPFLNSSSNLMHHSRPPIQANPLFCSVWPGEHALHSRRSE